MRYTTEHTLNTTKAHLEIKGLQNLGGGVYAGECLWLKLRKNWIYITFFDSETGKSEEHTEKALPDYSAEFVLRTLVRLGYKYMNTLSI